MMTSLRTKIGALLVKPALKSTLKDFDASEYGGAPLLGLNGLVVKTHGSSTSKEVCNSIIQCVTILKISRSTRRSANRSSPHRKKKKKINGTKKGRKLWNLKNYRILSQTC